MQSCGEGCECRAAVLQLLVIIQHRAKWLPTKQHRKPSNSIRTDQTVRSALLAALLYSPMLTASALNTKRSDWMYSGAHCLFLAHILLIRVLRRDHQLVTLRLAVDEHEVRTEQRRR